MIRYRIGQRRAARRALAAAAVGGASSLAPIVFTLVLANRLGWRLPPPLWAVVVGVTALVLVRMLVVRSATLRRLRPLVVVVADDRICVESSSGGDALDRGRVARILEVDGPLGGLRVETDPDPRTGAAPSINVPNGGEAFGEVRSALARWKPIERHRRNGPALRLGVAAAVVLGIFFAPFVLEDFIARSRLAAASLVGALWVVTRMALRTR